jgi:hypothetical protein
MSSIAASDTVSPAILAKRLARLLIVTKPCSSIATKPCSSIATMSPVS